MAETIGQHQISAFTSPVNGDPLDANVSRGNDNTIRNAYVDHDADPGIHVQSSTLASRPAANSLGRKWMSVDGSAVRLFYDTGTTWSELTAQAGTLLGSTLASGVTASSLTSVGTLSSLTIGGSTNSISQKWTGAGNNFEMRFRSGDGTVSSGSIGKLYVDYLNGTNINSYVEFFRGTDGITGFLTFGTQNTERMRISASGSVGIGTNNPGALLDVANTARFFGPAASSGNIIIQGDNTSATAFWITAKANSEFHIGGGGPTEPTTGRIVFNTGGSILFNSSGGTERMRIKANGQVRFVPLAADPAGAEAGDVYYNSSSNKLKVYNGTSWVDLH